MRDATANMTRFDPFAVPSADEPMKRRRSQCPCWLPLFVAVLAAAIPAVDAAAPTMPPEFEGLARVVSTNFDAVYLLPDADFSVYTKVLIDPVVVSFHWNGGRSPRGSRGVRRNVDEREAQQIADTMRSGLADIFAAAFAKSGYEVVTTAGPDVLRLSPAIVTLYINTPPSTIARTTRTFTVDSGEATLALQARDSTTGAPLGVAVDRRRTRNTGRLELASSAATRADFEQLFRRWAGISALGPDALRSRGDKRPATGN